MDEGGSDSPCLSQVIDDKISCIRAFEAADEEEERGAEVADRVVVLYYTLSRLYAPICYLKCKINSSPSVLLKGGKARGSSREEGPLQQGVPSELQGDPHKGI